MPKTKDYGVNTCEGCLEKQRIIDRQFEEINRLKQKLYINQRKSEQGFFGSSTPSSQIPIKENSLADKQARKGGGQVGHRGVGRQVFTQDEADEVRVAEVIEDTCIECRCGLSRQSPNTRGVYELEVERLKKVHYQIERKVCPKCRKIVSGKVSGVMPRSCLSNELVVEAAEQHYVLGRTLGQIAERFSIPYATLMENRGAVGQTV